MNNIFIPDFVKKIKIDVGLSYNAPVTQTLLEHDDDVFVFGFEPNPESIDCIKNKTCDYGFPIRLDPNYLLKNRCHLFNVALGNVQQPKEIDFYISKSDPGCSSVFASNTSAIFMHKTIKIPLLSLSYFLDSFDWNRFSYIEWLKIDAQGSDLEILKGTEKYLDKIVYITSEADGHQYQNCNCSEKKVSEYLLSHGFESSYGIMGLTDPTFFNPKFSELKEKVFMWQ